MLASLCRIGFPFLFGGTFIEGCAQLVGRGAEETFPFLFGGTFIEGPASNSVKHVCYGDFPSFSEGLSLRAYAYGGLQRCV